MPHQRPMFTADDPVRVQLESGYGVRFVRFLGRGGFSEVWHVEKDDAPLALKISIEPLDDGVAGAAIEELEIAKTRGVNQHPYIVKYFGRLPSDHLVTLWELGEESLLDVLERAITEGRAGLTWPELLDERTNPPGYMLQVAKALDDFHALGQLHRDIKPANLMLFGRYVKLADLGLAKRASKTTLRTVHRVGTLGYRPPEAERGEWKPTSDLYSAAAAYVKLRTGHEPFGEPDDITEISARQRAGDPIVDGLDDFEIGPVRHGLTPNPDDRPQDGVLAFFQTIRPGRRQTWFVPSAVVPEPNLVSVKQFEVPPIDIRPEPVRMVVGDTRGLPEVPAAIVKLLGEKRGLEETVRQLESEEHPSLRPAQAAIREAERQLQDLQADLQAKDLDLPAKTKAEICRRLVADPAESPSKLCQLAPQTSPRVLLPYVLRVRNVEAARRALDAARAKYDQGRTSQVSRLRGQLQTVGLQLDSQQGRDLQTILEMFFQQLGSPSLFPIEQWLEFEPLLAGRRYPWDERRLLELAEEVQRGKLIASETLSFAGIQWARIPAAEFLMGSPPQEAGRQANETQHLVRITNPLYMSVHPVTVGLFKRFVKATEFRTEAERANKRATWRNPGFQQDDTHPVVCASWNDAQALCQWLGQEIGAACRLPTEAEWEYACRGGAEQYAVFGIGDGKTLTSKQANFNGNSPYGCDQKGPYLQRTTPVGSYNIANEFGLCDMHGNVWEWCQDWYDADYCAKSPKDDPTGPSAGSSRVLRGGAWCNNGSQCRSACRHCNDPTLRNYRIGFRLVVSVFPSHPQ